MQKFHQISTDQYVPISHDNSFLFIQYEKVHNFIKTRFDPQYKNILAKPIKHNYVVEWFSHLSDLRETSDNQQLALSQYWDFMDKLEKQIDVLSINKDEDTQNWISLLKSVFNPQDNIIFNNDSNISIIWGWKFENNSIQRPKLSDPTYHSNHIINEPTITEPDGGLVDCDGIDDGLIDESEPKIEEEKKVFIFENDPQEEDYEPEPIIEENGGFLEFLKEFAGKYWWLLIVLLSLIVLVYSFKTLIY